MQGAHAQQSRGPGREPAHSICDRAERAGRRRVRPAPKCRQQLVGEACHRPHSPSLHLQTAVTLLWSACSSSGHGGTRNWHMEVELIRAVDESTCFSRPNTSIRWLTRCPSLLSRYSEVSAYDFTTGAAKAATPSAMIGHFTQVRHHSWHPKPSIRAASWCIRSASRWLSNSVPLYQFPATTHVCGMQMVWRATTQVRQCNAGANFRERLHIQLLSCRV